MSRQTRDDERGAMVVFTALAVVIVLAVTAFAVDLGMSRASARDMQAVADVVALDTARWLPNCNADELQIKANESLDRQGGTIGRRAPLDVEPGYIDPETKHFERGDGGNGCNAVRITSTATVDYAFAPVIGTDSGTTSRSAVATTSPPALCFSAGTKALVLNTSGSALGPVLDQVLKVNNLDVGGYTGLVALEKLNVPLVDLNAAVTAATGSSLLDATDVSLGQLMLAQATVVAQKGYAAQAEVLESIAARASSLTVNVSDFLNLDTTDDAGLAADVNALDLFGSTVLAASAQAANGKNAIDLTGLNLNLGVLGGQTLKAVITEPPVIACGGVGTTARTAQIRIDLQTGVLPPTAELSLGIRVADGSATLAALNCAASPPYASISGSVSAAKVVGYGGEGSGSLDAIGLELLALKQTEVGGGSATRMFAFTSSTELPPKQSIGGGGNINIQLEKSGLGVVLALVVNPVLSIVQRAINPLLTTVLNFLGIKLGTMDVTVLGRPSCDGVRLVG